jgi:predicted transcriptional regulator
VVWATDVDMGADRLWEMALEQTGHDTVEFLRWRWRYGLSLTDAANALGLSRRQVAYYAGGKHRIPCTVLLACKGWEVERQAA